MSILDWFKHTKKQESLPMDYFDWYNGHKVPYVQVDEDEYVPYTGAISGSWVSPMWNKGFEKETKEQNFVICSYCGNTRKDDDCSCKGCGAHEVVEKRKVKYIDVGDMSIGDAFKTINEVRRELGYKEI